MFPPPTSPRSPLCSRKYFFEKNLLIYITCVWIFLYEKKNEKKSNRPREYRFFKSLFSLKLEVWLLHQVFSLDLSLCSRQQHFRSPTTDSATCHWFVMVLQYGNLQWVNFFYFFFQNMFFSKNHGWIFYFKASMDSFSLYAIHPH